MKKTIVLLLAAVMSFSLTACTQDKELTLGEYDGNTYSNEFFGMSLEIPEGYYILSRTELNDLTGVAHDFLSEETDMSEQAIKLSEEKTIFYTMVMVHPLGYVEGFNPNIIVQSENLSLLGKALIKDSEAYLDFSMEQATASGLNIEYEEIQTVQLDEQAFHTVHTTGDYGIIVYQDYYSAIIDSHALTFIVSYTNDSEKEQIMSILETISFQ